MLNCLSPSTSLNVTCGAAEEVAAAGHAERHRRPAFEEQLLERALLVDVRRHQRVRLRRREVDGRPLRPTPKSDDGDGVQRFFARQRVDAVLALVVGHERDLRRLLIAQDDRRHVAGQACRCTASARRSSGSASRCCRCCRCARLPGRSAGSDRSPSTGTRSCPRR